MPVFGTRLPGCRYRVRPSAYAVIRDENGRVAVVRAARGWFLPGGGIEADETAEQAVERETREECGLVIQTHGIIGNATEIVHSPAGTSGVDKVSVFFNALITSVSVATEPDHELVWLRPGEAVSRLSHKSHRWAVTKSEDSSLKFESDSEV